MSASALFGSYAEIKRKQQDVPSNYLNQPFPPATGRGVPLVEQPGGYELIPNVAILWTVRSGEKRFRTTKPIQIHVYREGELFVAENETLMVSGTGESAWEAVEELELNIVHFWKYYNELLEDQVMADAKRLKSVYADLLVEEE